MKPLKEIFVPRLPEAPPLYRWEMEEDITCSAVDGEEGKDQAPRMPSRGRAIDDELQYRPIHKCPPRRPRRSPSPSRPMTGTEISNVPLKPLTSVTDGDGMEALVHIDNTAAVPVSHLADATDISVVFCIRNTACGSNRNHALQLKELAERHPSLNMLGVIKPIQTDAKYEVDFSKNYFPFPLYTDESSSLFTAMGERKLSVWKMIKKTPTLLKKCHDKKIHTVLDLREEFWIQGGLMIFDTQKRLRFVYYEKFADDLDLEAIEWAIQEARRPFVPKTEEAPVSPESSHKRASPHRFSNNPWHSPPKSPPPRQPTRSTE